ncbi:HFR083Wp [Eremothecium sinecaudum]|uniref:SURF1-like protein n=1 Tax=Eremothecium sinecaudum TaxID=45286 RepID=A0A0X8HV27_9SACH|nr:HFR083Wp [Eremothecium sinecaudum]AMD21938.1 HFR083Wp [Eremothecium sinecaudum]
MFGLAKHPIRLASNAHLVNFNVCKNLVGARGGTVRTVKTSTVDWKPIRTTRTPKDKEKENYKWTRRTFLGLMIAMPVVSFYLGSWQLRRLKWKTELIATCEDRLAAEPIPMPKHFSPEMCELLEYAKVKVKGKFLHDEEIFVGPKLRNGTKGYTLFTPFIRKDTGEKILIERGWISEENVLPTNRKLRHLSLPEGENVELTCVIRVPKARGTFQWDKKDSESRVWQIPDMPDIFASTGTLPVHLQALYDLHDHRWDETKSTVTDPKNNAPWWKFWTRSHATVETPVSTRKFEDDDLEFNEYQFIKAGVPLGVQAKVTFKNNHLQYLVTWYGLSLLSSIFLIAALRKSGGSALSQAQIMADKLKHSKKFS